MEGSSNRPGATSELSAWNTLPSAFPGGSHENVNLVESRENRNVDPTDFSSVEHLASLGDGPGNRPNNPYHDPPLYTSDGQGLDNYPDTHAREDGLSVLDGTAGSPSLEPSPLGFGGFEYPHARARDIYPDHQYNAAVLSALLANISNVGSGSSGPIPQAQDSLVAGGPHLGTQYLDAEGIYNFSPSDGESAEIPGSGVAGSPYGAAPGINPRSPGTPVTQIDPNKAVVLGRINPLSSHPASMVGNQRATPVPAESPLVAVNDLGFQNSSKRKRSASPDGGREGKRPRRKPRQHSATQEQTQMAQIFIPLSTRPDLLPVLQRVYKVTTAQDWQRLPSIEFTLHGEGVNLEGINLDNALNKDFRGLNGRDDAVFTDGSIGNSVSCRLEFVGHGTLIDYKPRQIVTKNHKRIRDSITREKLAYYVAKLVKVYLEKGESPFHIPLKDMFLTKLHHVAQASWQPELWYRVSASASS